VTPLAPQQYTPPPSLTPAQLNAYNPPYIFRTPGSSNNNSAANTPASRNYTLPAQAPRPKIYIGERLPPGYFDAHPNFKLNSDHVITFRSKQYRNGEILYHVLKFDDIDQNQGIIDLITSSPNPKAVAEQYRPYWRGGWERERDRAMLDIVHHKMAQYSEVEAELLGTGNAEIIDADDPANTLGRALMDHRTARMPRRQ